MLWITTFSTFALLAVAVYFLRADGRAERQRELRRRVQWRAEAEASTPAASRLRETESDLDALFSRAAKSSPFLRKLELMLYRAGNPLTLRQLVFASAGAAAALGALAAGLAGSLLAAPAALAGASLPLAFVKARQAARLKRFDEQFPEALGLFTRSLRAGHSLTAGMQMVASELPDPVGTEFALVAREIALGLAPSTAMANLQDRVGAGDLPFFVTAVLVQQETGGNLAEILDNLGKVIRDRMQFHGKVKSLTAQARFSANVLMLLPLVVAVLMYFVNPANVMPLVETHQGHLLAAGSFVMVAIGGVICRKLSQVEY